MISADLQRPVQLQFAMPVELSQWISGIEQLCATLESHALLPATTLRYGLVRRRTVELPDRRVYIEKVASEQYRDLLVSNAQRGATVTVRGVMNDRARMAYDVTVEARPISWDARIQLLEACGEAVGAYNGGFTPAASASALYAYANLSHPGASFVSAEPVVSILDTIGETLPALHLVATGGARKSAAQPDQLHWVNYWSDATCELLKFPDPSLDGEWLQHSRRTHAGAWIVRLTDEPLDVSLAGHVGVLARAYRRFAAVGIR